MKIFFTASYRGKQKYQKEYDKILAKLRNLDLEIISPELGNYKSLLSEIELENIKEEHELHYLAIKKGIVWANAVIIEISEEDFQLGHEATLAIQINKHVLCLSLHEDYSKKIINRYFHAGKYNDFSYEILIEEFVDKISQEELRNRFNLFLSDRQKASLENSAKEIGVNMSEYLRMLLDREAS